ncbi:hypothetical protein [Polyangium fumosum]|uniref:Uncharacterized protein n=1 Tax=Polyangium fumosum TaxID=889272 RepID=A0A4U1IYY8_9BACT|nr:hypothetical protein [Polyangium fumosum]TKC99852.1 hypothetical protein E8A74_36160 [Polyangium fumosum]
MGRVLLIAVAGMAAACGNSEFVIVPKLDAGLDAEDAGADADTDAGDGGIEAKACTGQCVPFRPLGGWSEPVLVAKSPGPLIIECPPDAPHHHFTKYAHLTAGPLACGCACKPSTGSCTLPTTTTASNAACNIAGADPTSFDPPADWDGSCSNANGIAAGKQCGGKPCVESLTIGPMQAVDEVCEVDYKPILTGTSDEPTWGLTVVVCEGYPEGGEGGCGFGEKCAPAPTPPPEFLVCVYQAGDLPCEGEDYTDRLVIYSGFEDKRGCTTCECMPEVEGSMCTATASIYKDDACVDPLFLGYSISSLKEACFDVTVPGSALGSKSISNVQYHAGTCQPTGGEPIGQVEALRPSTICCRPKAK